METLPEIAPKVDGKAYLADLRKLVTRTEDDLRVRAQELEDVHADLTAQYNEAVRSERTLETFESWRDQYLTQVAVGWVLSCVFLRYLEDNDLIEETWLAGEGERLQRAHDRHQLFFRSGPTLTDRDYLLEAFSNVAKLPGCGDLFGKERNPLWLLGPSGDMAKEILLFFQTVDPATGKLVRTFGDLTSGRMAETRFLGDLYQDLSEAARKRYALLQTPDFVEEFILDRTLSPAIELFGIDEVRMLDPTCGSGHFLLGGFQRLLQQRQKEKPAENERERVKKALDGVFGVDLNPFAVAIARFRLLVAALEASGITRMKNAPNFKIHVATGDSLLYGRGDQLLLRTDEEWKPNLFAVGDYQEAAEILSQSYQAVVGNPPYIVDKDKAHNNAVRKRYESCHRQFSLAVPFKELFFRIAVDDDRPGFIGMITANSFMKREFGTVLIEKFFPRVDLTHVIDTSGAYIPGHGTPTVILFGRNRKHNGAPVRAALGIRGEPSTPDDPAQGKVWRSIVELLDQPGAQNEFLSVDDIERTTFHKHPWSMGGGGAGELKEAIEAASVETLSGIGADIGFVCMTRADDIYFTPRGALKRAGIPKTLIIENVEGEVVRDWSITEPNTALFPYDDELDPVSLQVAPSVERFLWPYREQLWLRREPNGNHREIGLTWYEWSRFLRRRYKTPLSITFAEIATHNHFVLDRGGKVFKQTAPVIKLPPEATVDDHLALLGLLNSSVACFWLKQMCMGKHKGDGGTAHATPEYQRFQFDGTKMGRMPIVEDAEITKLARELDCLGASLAKDFRNEVPSRQSVTHAHAEYRNTFGRMIALQEELDWVCYRAYGVIADSPTEDFNDVPAIEPGWRAFEVELARRLDAGRTNTDWFERHGSIPVCEVPTELPAPYQNILAKRIQLIETIPFLKLLEKPEFKRRWDRRPWEDFLNDQLREWLLTRFEDTLPPSVALATTAQLTDQLRKDADFVQVAELYSGRDDVDLHKLVSELVMAQDVPYLPAFRYKETGLRKREQWERTWDLQRREDAGDLDTEGDANGLAAGGKIPVPPKYASTDFQKTHYWSLRGKLDVPKERFISYPLAERDSDPSPVIGWAGWDHAQQAQALAAYYIDRKEQDAWAVERLTPLLAGLLELIPWLKQWHNEIDPDMGVGLGEFYESFLESEARSLGLTKQALRDWRPPAKTKGRKKA